MPPPVWILFYLLSSCCISQTMRLSQKLISWIQIAWRIADFNRYLRVKNLCRRQDSNLQPFDPDCYSLSSHSFLVGFWILAIFMAHTVAPLQMAPILQQIKNLTNTICSKTHQLSHPIGSPACFRKRGSSAIFLLNLTVGS